MKSAAKVKNNLNDIILSTLLLRTLLLFNAKFLKFLSQ